jgi:tRNA G26 N,N-dimethylase Trm1
VTSFDVDCLRGYGSSSIAACRNKYDATPMLSVCSAEAASRLLMAFVEKLVAADNGRGVQLLFTLPHPFAIRLFVRIVDNSESQSFMIQVCKKCGAYTTKRDETLIDCCREPTINNVGPLWMSSLNDQSTIEYLQQQLLSTTDDASHRLLLSSITNELHSIPLYTTLKRELSALQQRVLSYRQASLFESIVESLKSAGFQNSDASHAQSTAFVFKVNIVSFLLKKSSSIFNQYRQMHLLKF